jgi:hypothetical protein
MVNGLGRTLPVATVLACMRHVKNNCAKDVWTWNFNSYQNCNYPRYFR